MTYIDAINQMWVANDSYDFTHTEIVVYMVILDRWNRAGRKHEVGIDYRDIIDTAKTCKTIYYRTIKKLAQVGLIAYKSGHKSSSLGKLQVLKFDNQAGTEREQNGNGAGTEREQNGNGAGTEREHYKEELKSTLENKENKSFLECVSSNTHDEKKSFESDEGITDVEILSNDSNSPPVVARPPSSNAPPSLRAVEEVLESRGFSTADSKKYAVEFMNLNAGYGWRMHWENALEKFILKIPNYETNNQLPTDQPRPPITRERIRQILSGSHS